MKINQSRRNPRRRPRCVALASTYASSNHAAQKPAQYKAASPEGSDEDSGVVVKTNNEGDKYVDLGRKRRATVRAFKGTHLGSFLGVGDRLLIISR